MSGGLRLLDVVTLGGKGRRFKLAAGIIGVEHQFLKSLSFSFLFFVSLLPVVTVLLDIFRTGSCGI